METPRHLEITINKTAARLEAYMVTPERYSESSDSDRSETSELIKGRSYERGKKTMPVNESLRGVIILA